mmetsp:Transcript_27299/g.38615  ORF Transcript_27299/g.38615 Transcript_27299/m.38615 type:complete len:354 (+) Transcript_27299:58-1119(+)
MIAVVLGLLLGAPVLTQARRRQDALRSSDIPSDLVGFQTWCAHSWNQKRACVSAERLAEQAANAIWSSFHSGESAEYPKGKLVVVELNATKVVKVVYNSNKRETNLDAYFSKPGYRFVDNNLVFTRRLALVGLPKSAAAEEASVTPIPSRATPSAETPPSKGKPSDPAVTFSAEPAPAGRRLLQRGRGGQTGKSAPWGYRQDLPPPNNPTGFQILPQQQIFPQAASQFAGSQFSSFGSRSETQGSGESRPTTRDSLGVPASPIHAGPQQVYYSGMNPATPDIFDAVSMFSNDYNYGNSEDEAEPESKVEGDLYQDGQAWYSNNEDGQEQSSQVASGEVGTRMMGILVFPSMVN